MKLNILATKLLLALVGWVLAAQPGIADAASNPAYNPDDLLLGFRASGGTGATLDYLVNIGPASNLSTSSVQQLSIGSTGADLASIFGSNWSNRSDVFWSISGTSGSAQAGTDPARTIYATSPETTGGTAAVPLLIGNSAAQSAPSNKIAALGGAYVQSAGVPNTFFGGSSTAITQNTTDANSYASFQPGAISYSYFEPAIEGEFANGTAGSILDFYKLVPATTGGSIGAQGTLLGRFIFNDSGTLTYIPVAALGTSQVQLAVSTDTVNDNVAGGHIAITVTRTGDTSSATSVNLATADGSAVAGTDYTAVNQTVIFGINEVSKVVNVPITNIAGFQADRTFTVTLTGVSTGPSNTVETVTITEAITPSVINFAPGVTYAGSQDGGTVTLQFVRSGGNSPVTATIAATDGSAVHATDFTLASTTVSFAGNATTTTVTINIVNEAGASQPNKQFTVALTGAGANATIDPGATAATVRILADDTAVPTVTISAPLASAIINGSVGGSVNVAGNATDNKGVDRVLVSLNHGPFVDATFTAVAGSALVSSSTYSLAVLPVGGLNTLQVQSVDARGHASAVVTRSFTYVVKVALAVNVSGSGTVTGKLAGPVYQVGQTYTLSAVPTPQPTATTNIFNGWSGAGLAAPATALAKLSFVFTDALALNPVITAAFIANPFTSTVTGSFNGLVTASTNPVVAPSNANSGFITLLVTSAGSYTGTLKIDGQSLPLTGQFDNTGHAVFGAGRTPTVSVPRADGPGLMLSAVTLDLSPAGTHQITGTLGQQYRNAVLPWSTLVASRAAFSVTSPVPPHYTVNKGYYTVVIPSQAQPVGSGLTTLDYPQGDGYGSITVSTTGLVSLSATLADGTVITASAPLSLSSSNVLTSPLFAQLYAAKAGSFGGLITLDDTQATHDLQGANFLWFKPYVGGQFYPYGWPEGVTTELDGAKYAAVAGTSVVPGLAVVVPPTVNAALVFSDGGLTSSITKDLNFSPLNVVTRLGTPADPSYTLSVTAGTGKITGSFTHSDGTKPAFNGMVFQRGSHGGAYGYFLTTTPKVIDGTGQSGGVSLTAP